MFIGMLLYDLLSYDKGRTWDPSKKLPLHKTVSSKRTKKWEPFVRTKRLTGSSIFYDCRNINPERLTLGMLKSAMNKGTQAANYAKVNSFIKDEDKIKGVKVLDIIKQKEHEFTADIIVNCTGPWSDIVLNAATDHHSDHHIRRSEGIHLITKKHCNFHAISMMTKNGRHVIFLPWRGHTIIGTTDKTFHGKPDDYKVTKQSILELLEEINQIYGEEKIKYDDILFSYGGMRPLVDNQTEGSYSTSRKYEISDNASDGLDGLISVEGGKYTTSRKLAADLIDVLAKKWGRNLGESRTDQEFLFESNISDMEGFMEDLHQTYPEFSTETIDYIGRNYGEKCHEIFKLANDNKDLAKIVSSDGELLAEVKYVIKNEMVYSLTDVFFRRTGIGTLGYPGDEIFNTVVAKTQELLKWGEDKTIEEVNKVMMVFKRPE